MTLDVVRVLVRPTAAEPLPDTARVWVTVADVGRVDAPAEAVVSRVVHPLAGRVEPVELTVPATGRRRALVVRVHVDVVGDGEVSSGDWVSTVAHPVAAAPAVVVVPLTRV